MFKSKEEFGEFLIQHGVGYDGRDHKDRDLWSKIETMPEDAAYHTVREPITVTDWKDGETKVTAQMATFLSTIWNQSHRRMPAYFKEVLAGQAQIQATLTALAQGSNVDMAKVEAAAAEGIRKGIAEWEQITAEEIAEAVVDEQAERLTAPKAEVAE